MSALTQDRYDARRRDGKFTTYPMAAAKKVLGLGLVNANASGYAKPAENVKGERLLGVAMKQVDNSAGANGALNTEVEAHPTINLAGSGFTQADVGKKAFVVDDQTVQVFPQPVNVTGVVLIPLDILIGGNHTLAFTAAGTTLGWGGGTAKDVSGGGDFILTATDGSQVLARVTAAGLPGVDKSDVIAVPYVPAGEIVKYNSATSVDVDLSKRPTIL